MGYLYCVGRRLSWVSSGSTGLALLTGLYRLLYISGLMQHDWISTPLSL